MRGLTSLFGMGRGEHPRQNHHKEFKIQIANLKLQVEFGICFLEFNNIDISEVVRKVSDKIKKIKAYGQLVLLGFDVTTFTPVAYQRHSL